MSEPATVQEFMELPESKAAMTEIGAMFAAVISRYDLKSGVTWRVADDAKQPLPEVIVTVRRAKDGCLASKWVEAEAALERETVARTKAEGEQSRVEGIACQLGDDLAEARGIVESTIVHTRWCDCADADPQGDKGMFCQSCAPPWRSKKEAPERGARGTDPVLPTPAQIPTKGTDPV